MSGVQYLLSTGIAESIQLSGRSLSRVYEERSEKEHFSEQKKCPGMPVYYIVYGETAE